MSQNTRNEFLIFLYIKNGDGTDQGQVQTGQANLSNPGFDQIHIPFGMGTTMRIGSGGIATDTMSNVGGGWQFGHGGSGGMGTAAGAFMNEFGGYLAVEGAPDGKALRKVGGLVST